MGIHLLFVNMLANRMSVNVPSRLGGPAILKGLVVYQLVGMFSCYFIAVGLGHVKPLPHVPMISDLCVSFPEAYVFRAVFLRCRVCFSLSSLCVRRTRTTGSTLSRPSSFSCFTWSTWGLSRRSCLLLWTPTRRLLRWSPRPRCGSSR